MENIDLLKRYDRDDDIETSKVLAVILLGLGSIIIIYIVIIFEYRRYFGTPNAVEEHELS